MISWFSEAASFKDPSNPYADYTMDQMYNFLSGYRMTRAPGSSFEYSNYSYVAWDPQRKIGVVVLANAATSFYDVVPQILRGLPKPFPVDPQVLAAYAGRYQLSDGGIVTIRVDGDRIFVQAPNEPEYELSARSENQFYLAAFDVEFTFYRNDRDEVDRMEVV